MLCETWRRRARPARPESEGTNHATKPRGQPHPAVLSSYLTKIARLGGYLARAKDPPPGNAVMWRGMSRLTDIELGFVMGAQLVGN